MYIGMNKTSNSLFRCIKLLITELGSEGIVAIELVCDDGSIAVMALMTVY